LLARYRVPAPCLLPFLVDDHNTMPLIRTSHHRFWNFGQVFWLQLHITDRCNNRCAHCYLTEKRKDLDVSGIDHILAAYAHFLTTQQLMGRLQIAGGEPLLSPHLFYLLNEAAQRKIPVRILTNGLAVTPTLATTLKGHGVDIVQVSVEGDEAAHDSIRGPGSYQKAKAACRMLTEAGIEVTIAATLHQGNKNALQAMAWEFRSIARRIHGARLVPIGEGEMLKENLLTGRQWRQMMGEAIKLVNRPELPELLCKDPTWAGLQMSGRKARGIKTIEGCSAGYMGLCLDTDGTAFPCRRLPLKIGNIFQDDFAALFNNPTMNRLRDRNHLTGKCGRCGLRWQCGGCRAMALAIKGDMMAADPQCPWPLWHRYPV